MPLVPIKLNPGVNLEATATLNESGWSESRSIRFFQGLPEKQGGFVLFTQALPGAGIPRALRAWTALSGISYLGIAGEHRLDVFWADNVSDITPTTDSNTIPLSLDTTAGQMTVVIHDTVNHPVVGEWLQIRDPVTVSNVTLLGSYGVSAVGAGQYTVNVPVGAATTVTGGGSARQFTTAAGSAVVQVMLPMHNLFSGQVVAVPDPTVVGGITLHGNYVATVVNPNVYTITAATPATSTQSVMENGGELQLTFFTSLGAVAIGNGGAPLTAGTGYAPTDTWTAAGGTNPMPATQLTITATQVVSAVLVTPGSGGTPGPASVIGTTGIGTRFVLAVTIGASGGIAMINSITTHGNYTSNPTNLTAELVADNSSSGLTGAVMAVTMGALAANITVPGAYSLAPANPVSQQFTSGSGTGATWDLSYVLPGGQHDFNAANATLANWGEFLLWNPTGGPVYVWMPSMGVGQPATNITSAPQSNTVIFVATQQQMLFCCGTVNRATGVFDPMLVAWSDAGDYSDFVPSTSNQAGSFRLTAGSRIVGGLALAGGNLIWTDVALYQSFYLQPPLVWGFNPQGINCGLVGPHAFGTLGQTVFWMSQKQFYVWQGGSPNQVPCTVWDLVFKNLDEANLAYVVCETNAFFNEISWEVPQQDGTTTRAKLQIDTGEWDYTILPSGNFAPRTAWIDQSVFGAPLAADAAGNIWQHEIGKDAGAEPLLWFLKSGIAEIASGDEVVQVNGIYPDIKFTADGSPGPGTVEVLVYFYAYSQSPPRVKGPYPVNSTTRFVPARGRARGLQFEFRGRDLGSFARLGEIKYRGAVDGKRP